MFRHSESRRDGVQGFVQTLDGKLGGAVRAQAGHAEGAGGAAEDEVAAVLLRAEDGEREREQVQCAEEVGFELRAEFVLVLVFAGADYSWFAFCEMLAISGRCLKKVVLPNPTQLLVGSQYLIYHIKGVLLTLLLYLFFPSDRWTF